MVAKIKAKFIPKDLNLFRRLHNLRHQGMLVKEYTEEFYKLNISTDYGKRERDEEKNSTAIFKSTA
jgi:hypothetical protein